MSWLCGEWVDGSMMNNPLTKMARGNYQEENTKKMKEKRQGVTRRTWSGLRVGI